MLAHIVKDGENKKYQTVAQHTRYHKGKASQKILAEIISYAIASHHGVFDMVEELFQKAYEEFCSFVKKINTFDKIHNKFYFGCLQRFLLSILMDSDWSDTSLFFNGTELIRKTGVLDSELIQENYQRYMERLLDFI
ncbi:HD domain-containing protein [[Clostridium] polysaccharolyticum]|uniref:HD Cas3-type domain-containing protein n=1 Tax=[Clostridium] polysaccharolyticum TaxID=29364 RepID=A0A1I0BDN8_9FIRM|nr:hypothetical protein [[Clostridium] polysaccharolyticum]SET04617.1 hypothetical protein SAMN04487772_10774 [[Clostridium] polysaccharolyticum]